MNNPWTLVPFYAFAAWLGMMITGLPVPRELPHLQFGELLDWLYWSTLASSWRLLIPMAVGSTLLSVLLASISYPIALGLIRRYRRRSAGLGQGQEA